MQMNFPNLAGEHDKGEITASTKARADGGGGKPLPCASIASYRMQADDERRAIFKSKMEIIHFNCGRYARLYAVLRLRAPTYAWACFGSCYRLNASLLLFKNRKCFSSTHAIACLRFRHEIYEYGIAYLQQKKIRKFFFGRLKVTRHHRPLCPRRSLNPFFCSSFLSLSSVCRVAVFFPIFCTVSTVTSNAHRMTRRVERKKTHEKFCVPCVSNKIPIYDAFSRLGRCANVHLID